MENIKDLVRWSESKEVVTSSRVVAEIFEKRPSEVNRAIKDIIDNINSMEMAKNTHCAKLSSLKSEDLFFESQFTTPESNGRYYTEYLMNRDGFTLLAMGFTGTKANAWKLKYIAAFNEMEKRIKENLIPEVNSKFMYQLAQEMEMKEKQIQEMKPKALFADAVATSHTSILIGELAKLISQNGYDIGQNRLFKWLRSNNYLIKRTGESYNTPTQRSMDLGLMETKVRTINNPDGSIRTTRTTKVTGKGQIYFINKFLDENKLKELA